MLWSVLACFGKEQDTAMEMEEPEEEIVPEEEDDLSWVNPEDLPSGENPCREPVRVKVNYVVDGDTFFADHGQEKVRIIGVDTPEVNEEDCYAQEAKTFLTQLINGKWVWLTFDGDCYDYYDRTLAYVHLGITEMDFVERQLLRGGYAHDFPFDNTDTFEDLFAADEEEARQGNLGGWGECGW